MLMTVVFAFIAGLILGVAGSIAGFSEQTMKWASYFIGGSIGVVIGIWIMTVVLKNNFSDFEIVLVRPDSRDFGGDA